MIKVKNVILKLRFKTGARMFKFVFKNPAWHNFFSSVGDPIGYCFLPYPNSQLANQKPSLLS